MHRKLANQSGALWMPGFLVQPDYRDRLPASDCPGMVPSLSIIVDQREASAHFGCGQKLTSLLERRLDRGGVFLADGKHGWEHERARAGRQARPARSCSQCADWPPGGSSGANAFHRVKVQACRVLDP